MSLSREELAREELAREELAREGAAASEGYRFLPEPRLGYEPVGALGVNPNCPLAGVQLHVVEAAKTDPVGEGGVVSVPRFDVVHFGHCGWSVAVADGAPVPLSG